MTPPAGVSTPIPVMGPDEVVTTGAIAAPIATFDDLLTRYQAELYCFALQLTRNRADADDLYQETLMKAFRAFGRLDGSANYRAWLYKIASNTFLSDRRKHGRLDSLDAQTSGIFPVIEIDHAASLDARALLKEVEAFVIAFPPKQRIALILRKYHELSYAEIAENLKCSEAAVRANVHQALRKLRDHFGVDAHARGWRVVARPLPMHDPRPATAGYDFAGVD
ncbi:MAG: RNA polymerase sigma factor [Thermomicrobiales bacterium]